MNSIFQALDSGYPPDEILGFLSKALPQISSSVMKAKKSGYAAKQILGFLSKSFGNENREGLSESERHSLNRNADKDRAKYGLTMAASAAALPLAAQALRGALGRAMPSSLTHNAPLQAVGNKIADSIVSPHNGQSLSENQPESQISKNPSTQASSSTPTVENRNISPDNTNISQNETNMQAVSESEQKRLDTFKKFNEKIKKPSLLETETQKFEEAYKPLEKGTSVGSPNGLGTIKEVRNGKALIDVDGKLHRVSEDELITSPLSDNDLADLFDDLVGGIEQSTGQDVSRNVDWAGFDPNTRELLYKPHGSESVYAYDNISDEDVEQLMDMLSQRKSSGNNFIGAWEAGSKSPIGASMYTLIKKLQSERGGKGSEYKNKFLTLYDALSPARTASRKRHEERKRKAKKSGLA